MEIKNRSVWHDYFIDDSYVAGVMLLGTEVKSLRGGKASFNDAYCQFNDGELWLKSLHITEYVHGTTSNHDPLRDRKLLLEKRELKKLEGKIKDKGYTIVPLRIFTTDKNLIKVEVGLARGKKLHDKRDTIKQRDSDRELKRYMK
jgi:SsrA-binding protein